MSTTVDNRVVEMRFDNKEFEKNCSTTLSSLDKLKQSLNLSGASKGLEDVGRAAKGVDLSIMSRAAETVGLKFNAMYTIADQALRNITNSAMRAGTNIVKALTIDPIKTGFQEYETQINAVQTILANTQSKGTTLKDVNGALDELNAYADKTIYNFTEMTRNIGTFTAAGVDLDKSVNSIKGIANLAAVSGSTSQQASTAMYQLSQALASGTVKLQDWNSVVNAGMGGQVFQDALKRTAKQMAATAKELRGMSSAELAAYKKTHGYTDDQIKSMKSYSFNVDQLIKKNNGFRNSLSEGWITSDVLNQTLGQLAGAYTEADLLAQGYSKQQAKEILELAKTAEDAATKVKTFTQLWDTLKEAAQSGWTQTWEIIVGDFEEAKALLTSISDVVGDFINKTSEARNNLLQGWKDAGGRTMMIDGITNIFKGLLEVIKPIGEAFKEIFPSLKVEQLVGLTEGFKKFTERLTVSAENADKIKRTFKGLFSIFDMFRKVIVSVSSAIGKFFGSGAVSSILDVVLSITATIGDFFTSMNEGFNTDGLTGGLIKMVSGISNVINKATGGFDGFCKALSKVGDFVSDIAVGIWKAISGVFTWITDNISAGDIFAGLTGGGIFLFAKKLSDLFGKVQEIFENLFGGGEKKGSKLGEMFSEVMGSVNETLQSFTSGIKVASLIGIAGAIAILSSALRKIADLDADDIVKSLSSIGVLFVMLTSSFKAITKSLDIFDGKVSFVQAGVSLMMIAESMNILAEAIKEIGALPLKDIAKGLIGVGGGMFALVKGLQSISNFDNVFTVHDSVAMISLAASCKILADAMVKFGKMAWDEIARGLTAMGGALAEFVATLKAMDKLYGSSGLLYSSASLLIAVQSLEKMADGLKTFGTMDWGSITRGLTAMGGALIELVAAIRILNSSNGLSFISSFTIDDSTAIVLAVQSLGKLADSMKKFGEMSWAAITRGLIGMGGALAELTVVLKTLAKSSTFSASLKGLLNIKGGKAGLRGSASGTSTMFAGGSLWIAVQALETLAKGLVKFSLMDWPAIGRGLVGMGGALTELSLVIGILGKKAGWSSFLGSGALLVGVQTLEPIAVGLKKIGEMTWDEIEKGLIGMGIALTELGTISSLFGYLTGPFGLAGAASLVIGIQGLNDLADAMKKFGEMSWDEITNGLAVMGGALTELAVGGFLNTLSIIGAYSISEMAKPLGDLADSVGKWQDVTVPEGLGWNLAILANGVKSFTLGGFGASAMAEIATPLGNLADSVAAWKDVTVPATLQTDLQQISFGLMSFTGLMMAGWSLKNLGSSLGDLATSVAAWKDVTVPDGLKTNLEDIANGLEAFSWLFTAGWSLDSLAAPLGTLATSIGAWKDVTVPDNFKDNLSGIGDGLKAFNWLFMAGWSLSDLAVPLGDLATSVAAWHDVTVPKNLHDNLKGIADAIFEFTGISEMTVSVSNVKAITDTVKDMATIDYTTLNTGLDGLSTSITNLCTAAGAASDIGTSLTTNIVKPIQNAVSRVRDEGGNIVDTLVAGINSKASSIRTAMSTLLVEVLTSASEKEANFKASGRTLAIRLTEGFKAYKKDVKEAVGDVLDAAVKKGDNYEDDFIGVGEALAAGLKTGINNKTASVASAAAAMVRAAYLAAKEEADVNSPSKVFRSLGYSIPEGFAMGIDRLSGMVSDSAIGMVGTAIESVKSTVSRISDAVSGSIDAQPTIRPVLDLSNVRSNAGAINDLLGVGASVGVLSNIGAISSAMSGYSQNGGNSEVVSAIDKLRKDLGKVGNTTYQVNGVTYDDGSNVSTAVEEIVRAARIERRV